MDRITYCIQCKDITTGQTGTFAYECEDGAFKATSPVFPSLVEFYQWAKDNGYKSEGGYALAMVR